MEAKWQELTQSSLEERVKRTYFEGKVENISHSDLVEKILELADKDWREAEKHIPTFSYPEGDPRLGCSVDNYGVAIDPISLMEIPEDKLISFFEQGKKWCFDIDSLAEYVRRSKPENPITRRQLPTSVVEELENYERATKTIVLDFTSPSDQEYSIEVIRGTPLVEVAMEILRNCESCANNSILHRVVNYKVEFDLPEWTFETEIEEKIPARIKAVASASYLTKLLESTSKRYALTSISDEISRRLSKLIKNMRVVDVFLYYSKLAGSSGTFHANLFYQDDEQLISFYDLLDTVDDYNQRLHSILPLYAKIRDTVITSGVEDFLKHFRFPKGSYATTPVGRKVDKAIYATFQMYMREAIKEGNFETVKQLYRLSPRSYTSDTIVKIIRTFSPEDVYELLGDDFVIDDLAMYDVKYIPDAFIQSGYYAKYLGFGPDEQDVMTEYFAGNAKLTPTLQTKLICMFNDVKLFEKYRQTLDYGSLYKFISHFNADLIAELLTERQKVELTLETGYTFYEQDSSVVFGVLEEFIKKGKLINSAGFNSIFLDIYNNLPKPRLSYPKLAPLLLRLARSNKDSFKEITIGLQHVVFDSERTSNLLSQEFLTNLYCRLIENPLIPQQLNIETFAAYFDKIVSIEKEIPESDIQKIFQSFGFEDSIEVYELSESKKYCMSFSDEEIITRAARHSRTFELAVEVGAISQERLVSAALYAINEWIAKREIPNWEFIYYYLTVDGLEKLDRPHLIVLFMTKFGTKKVTSRYAQLYIRNSAKAQKSLINYVIKNSLPLDKTGALSIIGVLEILTMGALVNLSQVCNLFEGVDVTPELKEKILSYPYLKMMYGDNL